ncbi:nitroreductase [Gordonia jinhuaensis]|uniref:Nitroreductase n=1 Tax=Gordonia jinhuaensis TaxID=1517702 RepID=A0A916WZ34_9ACTN|nr:nitroreductase family protein [Gordonia jinhuaensis]GGB43614.1 nitroreductase [Gordonia jinhuaensis]
MNLRSLIAAATVRTYTDDPVTVDQVRALIDEARWTGSARNRQPWRFVAVFDHPTRRAIAQSGAYAAHVEHASVVLVVLSPAERNLDTEFDVGRLVQSVVLAANSRGLGTCVVSLYPEQNSARTAQLLGAEPGWVARHAIALGHPGQPPAGVRSAIPTGRRSTDELLRVHHPDVG